MSTADWPDGFYIASVKDKNGRNAFLKVSVLH
jgi:hypothetical protein